MTDFKGEWAALSGAGLWALSSVVYSHLGPKVSPLILNLSKGAIAIALLIFTLLLRHVEIGNFPSAEFNLHFTSISLLLLSGMIGIGFGDTVYFAALNNLGPRRTLLLETLSPPLTTLLAMIFLQEQLNPGAWSGIFLTIMGVAWVISERVPGSTSDSKHLLEGTIWGLFAALAQATGALLSRAALKDTSIDPLWSSLLRLGAGVLVLLPLVFLRRPDRELKRDLITPDQFWRLLGIIALTAFFSTYLGIWLQQTALKFAKAGIAQTLGATSPLFVLPVAMWMGEVVTTRAILGAIASLVGIAMLFTLQ